MTSKVTCEWLGDPHGTHPGWATHEFDDGPHMHEWKRFNQSSVSMTRNMYYSWRLISWSMQQDFASRTPHSHKPLPGAAKHIAVQSFRFHKWLARGPSPEVAWAHCWIRNRIHPCPFRKSFPIFWTGIFLVPHKDVDALTRVMDPYQERIICRLISPRACWAQGCVIIAVPMTRKNDL